MARFKKSKFSTSRGYLTKEQKAFIQQRVKRIGSYQQVLIVYRLNDIVTKFARNFAIKHYKQKPKSPVR